MSKFIKYPKKAVKASISEETPSSRLIEYMEDGVIGAEDVVMEFIKYVSEDDVQNIITSLGLDETW